MKKLILTTALVALSATAANATVLVTTGADVDVAPVTTYYDTQPTVYAPAPVVYYAPAQPVYYYPAGYEAGRDYNWNYWHEHDAVAGHDNSGRWHSADANDAGHHYGESPSDHGSFYQSR